jgi:pilus assembly protein Flp/PilA
MGEEPAGDPAMRKLFKLSKDERGATAVEYGLIISLVVLAMLAGMTRVAGTTTKMWNNVSSSVSTSSN